MKRRPNVKPDPKPTYNPALARSLKRLHLNSTQRTSPGKYEQFLGPSAIESLSSAAPLALNIMHAIDSDEESEEEQFTAHDVHSSFERQRKSILSKYLSPTEKFVCVNLKSERRKTRYEPQYIPNQDYIDMVNEQEMVFSAPAERRRTHALASFDGSDSGMSSQYEFATYNGSVRRPPRSSSISSKRRSGAVSREGHVEMELNESWIQAVSMDIDEDATEFLATLPDVSSIMSDKHDQEQAEEDEEEEFMSEDPVQEALKTALQKQGLNAQEIFEPRPVEEKKPKKKQLSAAEFNEMWGFSDPRIGKYIRKCVRREDERQRK